MGDATFRERLIDYQRSNFGRLYTNFQILIGSFRSEYDIYWGDPGTIFDRKTLFESSPLAVTIIPHRWGLPDTRIFLHESLDPRNSSVFEMVVAHEIGHLWLHDIVGFNNPSTKLSMEEHDTERWCDYFAYCFFLKYREVGSAQEFAEIIGKAGEVQMEIYLIDRSTENVERFSRRMEDFLKFNGLISQHRAAGDQVILQMLSAIETTLLALGDIYKLASAKG